VNLWSLIRGDIAAWDAIWSGRPGWEANTISLLGSLRLIWLFVGIRAALLYRISHHLHRKRIRALPNVIAQLNSVLHGIEIPPSVPIGPRLYIPHPYGTVVMAQRIGSDVTLVSNITIGLRKGRTVPCIGDRVYVGAGARILGDVSVGNDVSIGANAVVIEDVPDQSLAVGVPARHRPARAAA